MLLLNQTKASNNTCTNLVHQLLLLFTLNLTSYSVDWKVKRRITCVIYCPDVLFPSQESVTDYTTPSSSLADSVPTGGNKMEESLVANVSTHTSAFYSTESADGTYDSQNCSTTKRDFPGCFRLHYPTRYLFHGERPCSRAPASAQSPLELLTLHLRYTDWQYIDGIQNYCFLDVQWHISLKPISFCLRWNLHVKHGRTPQVWRRIRQSPHLLPPSRPVHLRTLSPRPPFHRSLWRLLLPAPRFQVTPLPSTSVLYLTQYCLHNFIMLMCLLFCFGIIQSCIIMNRVINRHVCLSPLQVLVPIQHHPSVPKPQQLLTLLTSVKWSPSNCRVEACLPAAAVVAAASLNWAVCLLYCPSNSRPHRCTSPSLQQVRETWYKTVVLEIMFHLIECNRFV